MASQKMCFPETVIIVQHFLVSITISPAVRLFLALLCACVRACICVCPVNFCYVNVRLVLDISKRNHSFNKPIPHHAPEPQWENHIQHISQGRFVPQFDTESFMGMRFLYVGECVFAYLYVRGFFFSLKCWVWHLNKLPLKTRGLMLQEGLSIIVEPVLCLECIFKTLSMDKCPKVLPSKTDLEKNLTLN